MTSPSDDPVSRFGTYRLMHPIGTGGFGTVWRAELQGQSGFRKPVAIKLLKAKKVDHLDLEQRLRDEARMLGMIRHRNLVGVDDLVQVGERWAVVMEYVPGVDVEHLIQGGPLPPRVASEIAREVALALDAAHSARDPATGEPLHVVHRDIKPANIRVTPQAEVKVLDFGLARARFDTREALTGSMRMGTPGYMAPERLDGESPPGADIFALGVVLLESLLGQRLGVLSRREDAYAEAIEDKLALLPDELETLRRLIRDMLAYEDADRPTAGSVARRLQDSVGTLPGPWLMDWARDYVQVTLPPPDGSGGLTPESSSDEPWPGEVGARPGTLVPASGAFPAPGPTLAPSPSELPLTSKLSVPPPEEPPRSLWALGVGAVLAILLALAAIFVGA